MPKKTKEVTEFVGATPETSDLRDGLKRLFDIIPYDADGKYLCSITKVSKAKTPKTTVSPVKLGSFKNGVYAFFDYEMKPIYVGQTREKISGRISRHLTNQRTDAVAMSVLDPFEVCYISVWPLPQFQVGKHAKDVVISELNRLERSVFELVKGRGRYPILLNEKDPPSSPKMDKLPLCFGAQILPDDLKEKHSHLDVRIARRALTIARLSQVISERTLKGTGLRRALVVQAIRLKQLSERRFREAGGQSRVPERNKKEGEDEKGE